MRTHAPWTILALALCLLAPAPLRADDGEEEARAPLSVQHYTIGALAHGRMPFGIEFPPLQEVGDPFEVLPAVQTTVPERVYPLGQADEIIEIVKGFVLPAYWESVEGADIRTSGDGAIIVRAARGVHAELGRFLMKLESRYLRNVAVEVHAVRLAPKGRAALLAGGDGTHVSDERVAALLATDASSAHARVVVENRGQAETFGGVQQAFVRGHRSEVAQEASAAVPIVGVANPGLALLVHPTLLPRVGRVRVQLTAYVTAAADMRESRLGDGSIVQMPVLPQLQLQCDRVLEVGRWALVDGTAGGDPIGGWALLVRVTPQAERAALARRAAPLVLDVPLAPGAGPMEPRMYDVSALARPVMPIHGTGAFLRDSRFGGREEEEFQEAPAPMPIEPLVELVMTTVGGEASWEDPATIEGRSGMLILRNTPEVHDAVRSLLDRLDAALEAPVVLTLRAVATDAATARALAPAAGQVLLGPDALGRLEAAVASGVARDLGETRVTSMAGMRNAVCSARDIHYVKTYALKIAQAAHTAEPVMARLLAGLEVDAQALPSAGGQGALVEVRVVQTRQPGPMRRVTTAHGDIELPALLTGRLRSTLTVPYGRTAWIGAVSRPDAHVLLLLTADQQRPEAPR